jgi:hypothetical protein
MLQFRLYPDENPNGDTTELFQRVQEISTISVAGIPSIEYTSKKKKKTAQHQAPKSSVHVFPRDFHVQDKWPFLDIQSHLPTAAEKEPI